MLLFSYLIPVKAETLNNPLNSSQRIYSLINKHLELEIQPETDVKLTLSKTKRLNSFDNNTYILSEFLPVGYSIFNLSSGYMEEYSAFCPSPYIDYDNNLYYAGFKNYYKADNKNLNFTHIMKEETITLNKGNLNVVSYNTKQKNSAIIDYIEGKSSDFPTPMATTKALILNIRSFLPI